MALGARFPCECRLMTFLNMNWRLRSHWLLFSIASWCPLLVSCSNQQPSIQPTAPVTFGQRQLDQLLDDRPEMRGILDGEQHREIIQWIVDGFNGQRTGFRIYWNADSPVGAFGASHNSPYEGYPASISITGGTEETPVEKWSGLIFEMNNLEHTREFLDVHEKALLGKIDEDTYVKSCVRLEFEALKKTAGFFEENPLPTSSHGNDDWYNWVRGDLGTFEEYFDAHDSGGSEYVTYYRNSYQTRIKPYLEATLTRDLGSESSGPESGIYGIISSVLEGFE